MDYPKHYQINYYNGNIPISEVPIGSTVIDPSWTWEHRTGNDYTEELIYHNGRAQYYSEKKPVTWIVVAKNHYREGFEKADSSFFKVNSDEALIPHVTLISEALIGKFCFDLRSGKSVIPFLNTDYGETRWGLSGDSNAKKGLRSWLNSTCVHEGEGFYQAFSENFKQAVLTTTVPCIDYNHEKYTTQDKVFVPSARELGILENIGRDFEKEYKYFKGDYETYFNGGVFSKRSVKLAYNYWWYWTRTFFDEIEVTRVTQAGDFKTDQPTSDWGGVRPVLNIKAETLVCETKIK